MNVSRILSQNSDTKVLVCFPFISESLLLAPWVQDSIDGYGANPDLITQTVTVASWGPPSP